MPAPLRIQFGNRYPEAGCDEAGRGCLAGPVFAAAVILPKKPSEKIQTLLQDSKALSAKNRETLRTLIIANAVSYGVAGIDHQTIDDINILNASILAMHKALEQLTPQPEMILVDGHRFKPYGEVMHECIVKADSSFLSVAAASVLAKTYRDAYMEWLDEQYPHYGWKQNKGYPTAAHRAAIREFGLTPYHRRTFRQLKQQPFNFESTDK